MPVQDFNSFSIIVYYIISTTYQKIGDLFCPDIFLDFRTVCSAASAQESSSLTDTLHTSTWHDESQYGIASKLDAYDFKTKAEKTKKKEKCWKKISNWVTKCLYGERIAIRYLVAVFGVNHLKVVLISERFSLWLKSPKIGAKSPGQFFFMWTESDFGTYFWRFERSSHL